MSINLWNRNFLLIFIGQAISSLGTTILRFAISLYILDLTGSGMIFGSVMAISIIPLIILTPFGGILADRFNKGKMMTALDFSYGVIALALGYFLFGNHTVFLLSVLLILLSIVSSFELPVSQSAIPLVQTEHNLVKANALLAQVSMISGFIGPILAGILYSLLSIENITIISSICFFVAAVFELFINTPSHKIELKEKVLTGIKIDLKKSLQFMTKEEPSIFKTMLLIAAINLFISSLSVVGIPYMIKISLNLDSSLNGIAQGAMAGAGIIGGIIVGGMSDKIELSNLYRYFVAMGTFLIPIGVSFLIKLSSNVIYLVLVICFMMIQLVANMLSIFTVSAIQRKTPSDQLGRIMSFFVTLSMCAQPIGQILYGVVFDVFPNSAYLILFFTAFMVILLGIFGKSTYSSLGGGYNSSEN